MTLDPLELLVIVLALTIGGFIKGVTGSGLPQIAIPVMAVFLGVERSVVIMVIPGIVSNGFLIWRNRGEFSGTRDLPVLLGTGIVGAVAGTYLLTALDQRVLSTILAASVLVYVAMRLTRPELELAPRTTRWFAPPVGFAAGALQGASGISGPLLTTWLHSYRLAPAAYVLSLTTMFQVFSIAQGVTLVGLGMFSVDRLVEGFLALIPLAVVIPLGSRLAGRLPRELFDRVVLVLIAVSAIELLRKALLG